MPAAAAHVRVMSSARHSFTLSSLSLLFLCWLRFSQANTLANVEADTEARSERDRLGNIEADTETEGLGASLSDILTNSRRDNLAAFQVSCEVVSQRFCQALSLADNEGQRLPLRWPPSRPRSEKRYRG